MAKQRTSERGQTLVILALVITVLMLMAGLAIDVGMAYNERRDLQNAADAAALAGAQALCDGEDHGTASAIATTIGTANGATDVDPQPTTVTERRRMSVTTSGDAETFFFRLVGIDSVPVSAQAQAECSCAAAAGGLWPVAFDKPTWDDVKEQCDGEYAHLIVWTEQNPNQTPQDLLAANICDFCDCSPLESKTDLPVSRVTGYGPSGLGHAGDRGWLRLRVPPELASKYPDGDNCGANALYQWLTHGYPQNIPDGACVGTQSGVTNVDVASVKNGEVVGVVLFDPAKSCGSQDAPPWQCGPHGTHGKWLSVSGTGCMLVNHVYSGQGQNRLTLADPPGTKNNDKICPDGIAAIFVTVQCSCPWATGEAGGVYDSTCVPAVSLMP